MGTETDFVPGVDGPSAADLEVSHDSAHVPFSGGDIEDAEIDLGMLPDTTAAEIEKTNFRPVPPGRHTLMVFEVKWAGGKYGESDEKQMAPQPIKVYVPHPSGIARPAGMECRKVRVTYCVPGDERCQVSENFFLPPTSASDKDAWLKGFFYNDNGKLACEEYAQGKSSREGGLDAKKLNYFLARLGFEQDANGRFPKEAQRLGNWIYYPGSKAHRLISVEVKLVPDKKDPSVKYNNVVMFSHQYVEPPAGIVAATTVPDPEPVAAVAHGKKRK